ncbi:hypothetical protein AEU61_23440, partial [Salmonella enterica subsp. enterica serovar Heidelberg]
MGDQFAAEPHADKRGVRGLLVHMLQWFADAGEDPRTMAADGLHDLKNAQRLFAKRHRVRTVHLHKGIGDAPFGTVAKL